LPNTLSTTFPDIYYYFFESFVKQSRHKLPRELGANFCPYKRHKPLKN